MVRGLIASIGIVCLLACTDAASGREKEPSPARLPALDNEAALKLLPRQAPTLPAWARVLAGPLPKSTGALLELDYLHRARNPLGPILSSQLRWMTAHALDSAYGRACAEGDLKRQGLSEKELKKLKGPLEKLPAKERAALAFARKLSKSAASVTDEEMAELVTLFGPGDTVAIVHTLAYANFWTRMVLALGVEVEQGGALPPLDLNLDPVQRKEIASPKRPPLKDESSSSLPGFRLEWGSQSVEDLTKALSQQKERKSRIPPLDASRFTHLPPAVQDQSKKIVWMNISMGYQPQLTKAWFDCVRTFQSEASFDRVFGNSVFWVITRSNDCFY